MQAINWMDYVIIQNQKKIYDATHIENVCFQLFESLLLNRGNQMVFKLMAELVVIQRYYTEIDITN